MLKRGKIRGNESEDVHLQEGAWTMSYLKDRYRRYFYGKRQLRRGAAALIAAAGLFVYRKPPVRPGVFDIQKSSRTS